ncbi:Glycosyltransferase family 57 protein [Mycena indigotica]|uniref:Alpha-1,3-glucosyltransferase n=1 Tax=Mycena indigotica TaxID=2126181 RepID=A0A8H6SG24_9AGAR|nr:Glycosyltransferase family 57 protein [Mycena indigotica]KAF7298940.1 Glycosyltransferase family 57 protein [Mycena indigotica]
MEELSALPPDTPRKSPIRVRTISVNSMRSMRSVAPPFTRLPTEHERPEILGRPPILAPTPRQPPNRHLLEHSAQQWVQSLGSASSSRPVSPISPTQRFNSLAERVHHVKIPTQLSSSVIAEEREREPEHAMGRRWVRWMHKRGVKGWVVPCLLLASTLLKLCVGLGSYSGLSTPPMFGDYEAQRHWMELTTHLPFQRWYTYDLQYWGLDYPPLTAYISWFCGLVAHRINPTWVALDHSRGIETEASKVFMRSTVVFFDALVYVPALFFFTRTWQATRTKRSQNLALLTLLFQPASLIIDFGHFQYNSVMLGFTLLALNAFAYELDMLGAVFFVLSLGFKQMALYYAPAVGGYLLAKCLYLGSANGGKLFLQLALVTSLSFIVLFLPFLPPFAPLSTILDPITRIFPFARGLFEDKVANFWCASNVVFKWKNWASRSLLIKLSTALTVLGFLPNVVIALRVAWQTRLTGSQKPSIHTPILPLFPYMLLSSSMSFFLFSFQVHEKTILVPLLPITLLLSNASLDSTVFGWGVLANNIAVFSMWPLLKRDGLGVQYLALLALWNRLLGYNPLRLSPRSFIQVLSLSVYTAAISLHILELLIPPPARYPDLFPVLNVLISTPVFGLVWLWSIKCGVEASWALDTLGSRPSRTSVVVTEDASVPRRPSSIGAAQGRKRAPFTLDEK